MLELAAVTLVAAVALTFFSDALSRVVKLIGAAGRRRTIQVAEARHSA